MPGAFADVQIPNPRGGSGLNFYTWLFIFRVTPATRTRAAFCRKTFAAVPADTQDIARAAKTITVAVEFYAATGTCFEGRVLNGRIWARF